MYTARFLEGSFELLRHLRPGEWVFSISSSAISKYDQYSHLARLQEVLEKYKDLKTALGADYLVMPDIVVARRPVKDVEINVKNKVVDKGDSVAKYTPLRSENDENSMPILHASISCKWTMRSDRAQNTRTEALNLIRNRKANLPTL